MTKINKNKNSVQFKKAIKKNQKQLVESKPSVDNDDNRLRKAATEIKMNQQANKNKSKRLQQQKQQQIVSSQPKKLTRQEKLAAATAASQNEAKPTSLADLVMQAERKQTDFERTNQLIASHSSSSNNHHASSSAGLNYNLSDCSFDSKLNKTTDNSLKSFYKEVKKVIDASDVLIEVLDARDPLGSRSPQVEEIINSSGRSKKLVLLLNKIDLVPKQNILDWLKYLRREYPAVAFKSSTQSQNNRLSQSSVPIDVAEENLLHSAKCLGADILVKLLNNYTRVNDVKQTITVGIIGFPNVGKSSVINSLKRSHACQSGSTPGLTKYMQEIKLDKHIKLLDSPGIVMAKDESLASLALKNCVKIENLDDPTLPIELLVKRCSKEQLVERYKIEPNFRDANEFLQAVARRFGKLKKNDIADLAQAAHIVLNDWNSGKLNYHTQPPAPVHTVYETRIVTERLPLFDIDALLRDDEQQLFANMDEEMAD